MPIYRLLYWRLKDPGFRRYRFCNGTLYPRPFRALHPGAGECQQGKRNDACTRGLAVVAVADYLGRIAKNTMSSAATTTIPTMPRIRGRFDFRAGATGVAMFGMAGWAMAGGAKAWGEGGATGPGCVAAVCPNVS